jgi:hypothetical protein
MLMTIAIAYPMWDVGFEIGVYGKIFFEKIFSVWAVSTALLVALILVPRRFLEVTTPMLVATAFPSLWFGFALIARWLPELTVMGKVVFATGLVIYLGCVRRAQGPTGWPRRGCGPVPPGRFRRRE